MPNLHERYNQAKMHEEANQPHPDPLKPPTKKRKPRNMKAMKDRIAAIKQRMMGKGT
jgi:hypothetical protein